jgi:hypothetical protein
MECFRSDNPGHRFEKINTCSFYFKKGFIILIIFLSGYFNLMILTAGLAGYFRLACSNYRDYKFVMLYRITRTDFYILFFTLFFSVFNRLWIEIHCFFYLKNIFFSSLFYSLLFLNFIHLLLFFIFFYLIKIKPFYLT